MAELSGEDIGTRGSGVGEIMPLCKACSTPIIWIKTAAGKNMPIDAKPVKAYVENRYDNGWRSIDVHMTHWATCPKAHQFKKTGGKK